MSTFVFPDTNVWLHFRSFSEFDWAGAVGKEIVIVATPPLTRELDGRKKVPRTRDRARRSLRAIEEWESGGQLQLRPGVAGSYWHAGRQVSAASYGLDPAHADDVILAYVKAFCDANPDKSVAVLSDDLEFRLTAKRLGLRAIEPPEAARLPEEQTEEQAEIRRLRVKLSDLENRLPKLSIRIRGEGGDRGRYEVTGFGEPIPSKKTFVQNELRRAAARAPEMGAGDHRPSVDDHQPSGADLPSGTLHVAALMAASAASFLAAPASEYTRYSRERTEYLKEVAAVAAENWEILARNQRSVFLTFELSNDGTAPARDTDVQLHIPNGPEVIRATGKERVDHPDPPERPRSAIDMMARHASMSYRIRPIDAARPAPLPNVTLGKLRRSNSYETEASVTLLKQHTAVAIDTLGFVFQSVDDARSLGVEYEINSASLPQKLTGIVHVIFPHDRR
jgi:hypothetical protein